jgi:hypothetical protein
MLNVTNQNPQNDGNSINRNQPGKTMYESELKNQENNDNCGNDCASNNLKKYS